MTKTKRKMFLIIRCNEAEKKLMAEAAKVNGTNVSDLVRCLVIEFLNNNEREKEADQVSENKNFSMGYTAPRFHP